MTAERAILAGAASGACRTSFAVTMAFCRREPATRAAAWLALRTAITGRMQKQSR